MVWLAATIETALPGSNFPLRRSWAAAASLMPATGKEEAAVDVEDGHLAAGKPRRRVCLADMAIRVPDQGAQRDIIGG